MFELKFLVKKPLEEVYEILANMHTFASVHPLIQHIECLGECNYKIFEQVKFGPFNYAFTYTAEVNADPVQKQISVRAFINKFTQLELIFKLCSLPEGTRVFETVTIHSILPIKRFMHTLFEEQHTVLFSNINELKAA